MMTRLLMISSAAALLGAPVLAQDDRPDAPAVGVGEEQPVQPGPSIALDAEEIRMDTDGDGDLETLKNGYTDQHAWIDAPVYADGERVGDVERVHYEGEEIDAIVIEMDGLAEVGGREVEIPLEDAELTEQDNGEKAFTLAMTAEQIEALPDFEESLASDYPLSDNPAEGHETEAPGEGAK